MALALGSLALVGLGTNLSNDNQLTWDCWKPILHEESLEPSHGKLIREIIEDSRIKKITIIKNEPFPEIILLNVWEEEFKINFGFLRNSSNQLAAHATRLY